MRNEPHGGEDKWSEYNDRERRVLLSLFTSICDRPLPPQEVFPGKLTYFYPSKMYFHRKHISFILARALTVFAKEKWF